MISRPPWPLSELTDDEYAALMILPPKFRATRISKLKKDILSGERARNAKKRAAEEHLRRE